MKRRIHISKINENTAVCFDTGLDPRAFARTKMSQSLVEKGYVVSPDGSHEVWKAAGVSETNGLMRVWGPMFAGERLDLLIEDTDSVVKDSSLTQQNALGAVVSWIRAKMFLGETQTALNPGAAFVSKNGVFFAPEHLSNRCLFIEGIELDRFNCPDLLGFDAAAFCAGLMLYKILSKSHPYPTAEIYQDMREGIFLPVHLAAPELNKKLSDLIQAALYLPVEKKRTSKSGADILTEFLGILMNAKGECVDISSVFTPMSSDKKIQAEKEKKSYLFRQNSITGTKRFVMRNKHLMIGMGLGFLFVLFVVFSMTRSNSQRPTTAGMSSDTVIFAYYDAFSSLNHTFMESCIMGADRSDINAAASFFAVVKARQAYEFSSEARIIPARVWLELGGQLPAPDVFGVTNLTTVQLAGSEYEDMIIYRAEYLLWSPMDDYARSRTDVLTLRKDRRKNWRITEILRTER